jgi:uncharacterized membrane protein YecN with MAPEG domain
MKIIAPVATVTAIVLVPIYIQPASRVIALQLAHRIALGSGNYSDPEMAIRAHGNCSEYVPSVLLFILCHRATKTVDFLFRTHTGTC